MDKEQVLLEIQRTGLVAVVRASGADDAARIAEACLEGGVNALEITFTVPGAHRVLAQLAARYPHGEMLLGAGTVLDPETARIALLEGAQFVVSPSLNPETVRQMCIRDSSSGAQAGAGLLAQRLWHRLAGGGPAQAGRSAGRAAQIGQQHHPDRSAPHPGGLSAVCVGPVPPAGGESPARGARCV